jgi:hypothetical protein
VAHVEARSAVLLSTLLSTDLLTQDDRPSAPRSPVRTPKVGSRLLVTE